MRIRSRTAAGLAVLGMALALAACATPGRVGLSREVTASAYNSLPGQTSGDPSLGAWGDRLVPGMKAIAVSRDLLDLGLVRGTRVRIEGLPGEYVVLDKMGARWKDHIDLYMGEDVEAARTWGRRRVRIHWSATD
jgi:3D (Asp-Asp-Asp) domain-containing protein